MSRPALAQVASTSEPRYRKIKANVKYTRKSFDKGMGII